MAKLAYMIEMSGIDEPRRLFHVNHISKKILQKCIIHIQLLIDQLLEMTRLHTVWIVVGLMKELNVSS